MANHPKRGKTAADQYVSADGRVYINTVPGALPEGKILVHNHVVPSPAIGNRGFRVWLDEPSNENVECTCWFAPQLGKHYRRKFTAGYEKNDVRTLLLGRIYQALGWDVGVTEEEADACYAIEEAVIAALEEGTAEGRVAALEALGR